jgi:sensor histidine kinase YesM
MNALIMAFGIFLNSFPYFMLGMVLMWNHLRHSRKHAVIMMALASTLHATSILLLTQFVSPEVINRIKVPHEVAFMCLYVIFFVWVVKFKPTRLLFMALFVKHFADLVTGTSAFLVMLFWPNEIYTSFNLHFNLVHLALLCITYPLMYWFIRSVLRPLYLTESKVWNFLWAIPAAFYALNMFLTGYYDVTAVASNSYIIPSTVMFGVSLLVYKLVVETLRVTTEKSHSDAYIEQINRQLAMQRSHYEHMTETEEAAKMMRHDIRHHFAAVGQLAAEENAEKVKEYMENLTGKLVAAIEQTYCANYAVNAVAAHYLNLAENEGITVNARLKIPEDTGRVPALDLCVILGNLLENALEACQRMKSNERFIHAHSVVDDESISIVISNSFDGEWHEENGAYLSRKSPDKEKPREGIGLPSAKAVCEKHGGLVLIETTENVWKTSALVNIK